MIMHRAPEKRKKKNHNQVIQAIICGALNQIKIYVILIVIVALKEKQAHDESELKATSSDETRPHLKALERITCNCGISN